MNFKSDNTGPVHPAVLEAIKKVNIDTASPYQQDEITKQLQKLLDDTFETNVHFFFTSTGTAANSLSLAALTKPHELIFCYQDSHIHVAECNAPEFFTGGAKLVGLSGLQGKINISDLEDKIKYYRSLRPHISDPATISLTQLTEVGTIYTLHELHLIQELAARCNLLIHMDGARFANALAFLGNTPAELTWKSGVDILSFGMTKNGGMVTEIVLCFGDKYANHIDYLHKRSGQLIAKSRFLAVQFIALLKDGLWINNALNSNKMALQLSEVIRTVPDCNVIYPVQGNLVFAKMIPATALKFQTAGVGFYPWDSLNDCYRFVCSYNTNELDILNFKKVCYNFQGVDPIKPS